MKLKIKRKNLLSRKMTNLRLDPEMFDWLLIKATEENKSINRFITDILEEKRNVHPIKSNITRTHSQGA
jgi:predicted HicB family RNase H-like nuclease